MTRRVPLLLACAVVLAGVGAAVTLDPGRNPAAVPGAVPASTESSALFCTGLTASPHRPGRVTFVNTGGASRALSLEVVADTGRVVSSAVTIAAHGQYSIQPSTLEPGAAYAVSARVDGSGVLAEEVAGTDQAAAPCASAGTTSWSAAGLSTLVGSTAELSVFNPTATTAVFNTAVYTAAGFSAPQAYQGVSVPAHAERVLNLASQVVNTSGIGVALKVLRGSLVVVGVEDDQGTLSLDPGQAAPLRRAYFPAVTTADRATASLRIVDPGPEPAEVTVRVALGTYRIAAQHVTVSPYSTGVLEVTPNSAIPPAGYASLSVRASVPVILDLATGSGSGSALSAPVVPARAVLVHDFTSRGFDAVRALDPGGRALTVTVREVGSSGTLATLHLEGHGVGDLAAAAPALRTGSGLYAVTSTRPVALGLTLPGRPAGTTVLDPLDGR